jgi:hypothetical protein
LLESTHAARGAPAYFDTWLVRNFTTGSLQVSENIAWPNVTIAFECSVPVRPL